MVPRKKRDNPVRFPQFVGAQDHGLVPVKLHAAILPHTTRVGRMAAETYRSARLMAEMIALKDAVVMDWSIPTPQRTCPSTSAST